MKKELGTHELLDLIEKAGEEKFGVYSNINQSGFQKINRDYLNTEYISLSENPEDFSWDDAWETYYGVKDNQVTYIGEPLDFFEFSDEIQEKKDLISALKEKLNQYDYIVSYYVTDCWITKIVK